MAPVSKSDPAKSQSLLRLGISEPILAAIVMAIICSLLFHGVELVNFSLDADEENVFGRANPIFYALQLKWGAYLTSVLLLPETIFPVTALAIFLFAYGLSFVLLIRILQIQDWRSVAVAAPLFFGFPVLLNILVYNNVSYSVGLGMLAATGALWLSQCRSWVHFTGATLLLAFAISTYQSVLWFAVVIFLAQLLASTWHRENQDLRGVLAQVGWYASIFAVGLVVYFLIGWALLKYIGSNVVYIVAYLRLDAQVSDTSTVIWRSAVELLEIYGGYAPIFISQGIYYQLLALVLLCVAAWQLVFHSRKGAAIAAGLVLLILLAPFLQHPTAAGFMPYRTLVGVPAAIAVIALFATETAPERIRRWLLLPLSFLVVIEFSSINNIQYYSGHWRTERDKLIASQIVLRLKEIAPSQTTYRIAVVGAGPVYSDAIVRPVKSSSLAYSIFEITGGNRARIANYLRLFSDAHVLPANPEQLAKAIEFAVNMPVWPVPGSIAQLEDIFVIKFGEVTQVQLLDACKSRQSDFCSRIR